MDILILGAGGREHALAWAVRQNPKCGRLIVAPGNAGTAVLAETATLDPCDPVAVTGFCVAQAIDLLIIGPEAPLAAGVADAARAAGIATFGPSAAAARLEASKAFTKEICDACGAPTAAWARFTDAEAAAVWIAGHGAPIVVKADGLAAGKGVVVAKTVAEAQKAARTLLAGVGASIVIEEFMAGEEASFFVLCDGTEVLPIGTAQDHKRAGDGDTGPNTGGMGAFSPAPVLTDALQAQVMARIIRPTLAEMARRGTPYQGVLYAGLMIDGGPEGAGRARLVEYNARFGDPEAQVLAIGTAQDHKRAGDGDTGPNTGGMGAFSPAPVLTDALQAQVMARIIRPTLAEMARRGTPYQGVLYAGLMIDGGAEGAGRARLVEYNARFGDPEAQVLAMRLGGQLLDLIEACATGRLSGRQVHWAADHALCVVMAARGYPGAHGTGDAIGGLETLPQDSRRMVFHAGTRAAGGRVLAAGGRVLGITARAETLGAARDAAYAMVDAIDWPGGFCRRDIGWRGLS